MKIQIDTVAKTIRIEEAINLGELTKALEKLLPKGEWKTFKLESAVISNWGNPIYIPYNPNPFWYSGTPIVTLQGSTSDVSNGTIGNSSYTNSVYNVELSSN